MDPFQPSRHKSLKSYNNAITYIDNLPSFSSKERNILKAIVCYTPNINLLKSITSFNQDQIREFYKLSEIALLNLRDIPVTKPDDSFERIPRIKVIVKGGSVESSRDSLRFLVDVLGIEKVLPDIPTSSILKTRNINYDQDCLTRQQDLCAITGINLIEEFLSHETAHLFPWTSLTRDYKTSIATWKFLVFYLGEELRDLLVDEITSEKTGIHTITNNISMITDLKQAFTKGFFSLTPLPIPTENPSDNFYDVEFKWKSHPKKLLKVVSCRIDLCIDPEKQFDPVSNTITHLAVPRLIRSLEVIRLFTCDSKEYPLPSRMLLFWHEALWRVLGAAGLAEIERKVEGGGLSSLYDEGEEEKSRRKKRKFEEDKDDDDEDYRFWEKWMDWCISHGLDSNLENTEVVIDEEAEESG